MTIPTLSPAQSALLIYLLQKHLPKNTRVFAFGSRIKGNHRPASDLDLSIDADLSLRQMALLRLDLEDSDLPFRVDLSLWQDLPESFQRQVLQQHFLIEV